MVTVWCFLHLILGWNRCFRLASHTIVTLRASWYAPPDTGASSLQLVAVEYLPSIEGTLEIQMDVTFLRGPCRGAVSRRLTERLYQICVEKPKPQIQFAVWKGRNGLRGKEAPRTAGLVPPRPVLTRLRRPHLFSRKRKDGGEKSAWMRLVHPASEFRKAPGFWMSFHSVVTLRVFTTRRLIRGFQICN